MFWAVSTSGRYDIIFQIVFWGNNREIDQFFNKTFSKIANINSTDTMLVLNAQNQFGSLPVNILENEAFIREIKRRIRNSSYNGYKNGGKNAS